ncbi:hypothetical protein MMC34_005260 [Xylographa carneopallida]|nr:hypothetical protein [Xylographa carneopallida]
MGGNAFSQSPHLLSTPRIPHTLYVLLRDKYICLLSTLYQHVASPIEAPEKASHGDIDILVTGPHSTTTSQSLSQALAAKTSISTSGSASTSFAIPFPNRPDEYIQLDIHVCPASTFTWELFTASHGDLWNLLGTSLRGFGLTANNVGLNLRIAEIDHLDRKRSMLFLTSDSTSVLELMGLDVQKYWRQFPTVNELYEYVVSMRFFRKESYVRETLKSNDRKRMAKRPLYQQFVDDWLPERTVVGEESKVAASTRESVLEEVLDWYGKRVEYEETLRLWRKERADLQARQQTIEQRRAGAIVEGEYADAWIQASHLAEI